MTVGRGTGGRPGFRRQMRAGHGGARQIVERATAPETSIPPPPRALATPALDLRAATPWADVTVVEPSFSGLRGSAQGARGGERGLAAAPIPTQARNRAKTLVLQQSHELPDKQDLRKINCDVVLQRIFRKRSIGIFGMTKALSSHLT